MRPVKIMRVAIITFRVLLLVAEASAMSELSTLPHNRTGVYLSVCRITFCQLAITRR